MPEFRRAIDLFERCGVFAPEEAEEWRKRLAWWVAFRFDSGEGDETTPLS